MSNWQKDIDVLHRIPLFTDGPWYFAPVQLGTPPQSFNLMLDTGSSLSWIQTADCSQVPASCNRASKFNTSLSSTLNYFDKSISVKYTEGYISTDLASDIIALGTNAFDTYSTPSNTSTSNRTKVERESDSLFVLPKGVGAIGLTNDISGDSFLLRKEDKVSGFLGASQRRFEAESDYKIHIFSEIVRSLPTPVFSLAFADTWGTLTLGGPDPSFHSEPLTWLKTLPDEAAWATRLDSRIDLIPHADDQKRGLDYVETDVNSVWFDSGTTYIWGDQDTVQYLNEWMGADSVTGQVNCSSLPNLGNITFSIGGTESNPSMKLELTSSEYIVGKTTSRRCFSALYANTSSKNHWIFGVHLLRKYYSVYHYGYSAIGIAPYNITELNPVGKVVLPGSHASLEQDLRDSLRHVSLCSKPCTTWFSNLITGGVAVLLAMYFVTNV